MISAKRSEKTSLEIAREDTADRPSRLVYNGDIPDVAKNEVQNLGIPEESKAHERKLTRTLDLRLMPCMIVIFILNYVSCLSLAIHRPY